ncbi:MAG: FAD-dependent oxidoreductase [Ruminococcaceae bacterium]|nr:FAD-dependent oxidoreductase [Oscillospiraceae bacterium]
MIVYSKELATENADVLIIGGGPAGLCAALASARAGANTLLIEQAGFCGGMATAGLVAPFMTCYDSGGKTMLIRGLFEEIVDRLVDMGGALHPSGIPAASAFTSYITAGHIHVTPFRAEALKLLADRMLKEAGVKVLYHTSFVDAITEGERVKRVIIARKEGLCAIDAKVIVDCTGDGDCAAAAGVPYTMGNGAGRMQPATMFFRIGNVDSAKIDADIEANWSNFYRKDGVNYRSLHWWVSRAREAGDWTLNRVSIGLFRGVDEDEWSINTSRIMGIDGTCSESLTDGEQIGREQADEIFRFLKKYVPGCENAKLLQTGSTLGIRETRHIHGMKTLSLDDILECRVPDDAIMLAANSVDVHGRFGPTSNEYITIPEGKYYGIPYGCLVPENRSNLLVAGRCLSADSEAAGAVRVMPPCMGMGQAAGTAAALACLSGSDVRTLDTARLRSELEKRGVLLHV